MSSQNAHEQHLLLAQQVVDALVKSEPALYDSRDLSGIWLFGSVARRTDTSESDVDMLATYSGRPSTERDKKFHSGVVAHLTKAGIPLGDPHLPRKQPEGVVTIQTMPDLVFQHPEQFIDLFQTQLLALLATIKSEGQLLHPTKYDQAPLKKVWGSLLTAIRSR